jgi:hypothetical protein
MMAFEDRSSQIIKLLAAGLAMVTLAVSLMDMKATFVDQFGVAMRTMYTIGPADFAHFFVALLLVDQVVDLKIYTLILPFCFFGDHLLETR